MLIDTRLNKLWYIHTMEYSIIYSLKNVRFVSAYLKRGWQEKLKLQSKRYNIPLFCGNIEICIKAYTQNFNMGVGKKEVSYFSDYKMHRPHPAIWEE